jgi:hypothetical protein
VVQDLNSLPFLDFQDRLREAFRETGAPLIYAGGHDHSLQVIEGPGPLDPHWSLVSGSGVKVTEVGHVPGMRFRAARAGYMTVVTQRNGESILYVRGVPERWVDCPNSEYPDPAECMANARSEFETLFSIRLSREG